MYNRWYGKVMFLHLSVILFTSRVSKHAMGQTPRWVDTPRQTTPPPGRLGYGSAHPTGMHTCYVFVHLITFIVEYYYGLLWKYRSGMVNSNTINSKFHLIRSYCEYLARILSFHVLKCTVNSNMVSSKFH